MDSYIFIIGFESFAWVALIICAIYEERIAAWEQRTWKRVKRLIGRRLSALNYNLWRPLKRWVCRKLAEDGIYAVMPHGK